MFLLAFPSYISLSHSLLFMRPSLALLPLVIVFFAPRPDGSGNAVVLFTGHCETPCCKCYSSIGPPVVMSMVVISNTCGIYGGVKKTHFKKWCGITLFLVGILTLDRNHRRTATGHRCRMCRKSNSIYIRCTAIGSVSPIWSYLVWIEGMMDGHCVHNPNTIPSLRAYLSYDFHVHRPNKSHSTVMVAPYFVNHSAYGWCVNARLHHFDCCDQTNEPKEVCFSMDYELNWSGFVVTFSQ